MMQQEHMEAKTWNREIMGNDSGKQGMTLKKEDRNKNSCITDVKLNSNNVYVDENFFDKADGGMDVECQESLTNIHERVTKGGNLPHVLHDAVHNYLNRDLRDPPSPKKAQQ